MRLLTWLYAKVQHCNNCNHLRTIHSRRGCEEAGCFCMVPYMDKDMFS